MTVECYIDNDTAYLSWISINPDGFVANATAHGRSYAMLHKVSHHLSTRGSTHPNCRTHTYAKLVSNDILALKAVLVARGYLPRVFRECKTCRLGIATEFESTAENEKLHQTTTWLLSVDDDIERPIGSTSPLLAIRRSREYLRSPHVRAWTLRHARGRCELCGLLAPFTNSEGMPYLEVHHIVSLANTGTDTVDNCVALCPNCHREVHHGQRAANLVTRLKRIGSQH